MSSGFEGLASQIESEKERVAREKAEARAKARAAKMAAEVAKKQAVEEALRSRGEVFQPATHLRSTPVLTPKKSSNFSSLLSQIESEKQRIEAQKAEQANKPKPERSERGGKKGERGGKKGKRGNVVQVVPELENQAQGEDRYAQILVQAGSSATRCSLRRVRLWPLRTRMRVRAAARSARRSARQRLASAWRWKKAIQKGLDTRSCSTTPSWRFPRVPTSPSSPSCSACS